MGGLHYTETKLSDPARPAKWLGLLASWAILRFGMHTGGGTECALKPIFLDFFSDFIDPLALF